MPPHMTRNNGVHVSSMVVFGCQDILQKGCIIKQ